MKVLKRIAPLQLGKILSLIYLIMCVPIMGLMFGIQYLNVNADDRIVIVWGFVGSVFGFPVIGLLTGLIGAWVYNLSARLLGGTQFECEDAERQPSRGEQVLKRISPLQLGKILALMYIIIYAPLMALFSGAEYFTGSVEEPRHFAIGSCLIIISLPFFGLLTGVFGAWAYNFSARLLGGARFEIENGKFVEKLPIDSATPSDRKEPCNSHYHLDDGKTYYSPRSGDRDPEFNP